MRAMRAICVAHPSPGEDVMPTSVGSLELGTRPKLRHMRLEHGALQGPQALNLGAGRRSIPHAGMG
jgi:hypothetical protein